MKYLIYILLVVVGLLTACSEQESDYERMVQQELNSGVRHDSLFLGFRLGMQKEHFFDHSWQLNQKKIVTGNSQVEYELENLSAPAKMVFYPDFHNDRIYRMPVEISFKAWAPWNRHLYSDSLANELVDMYSEIYGGGFIKTTHPEIEKEAWIKVDGNRRIIIYRKDDMKVRAEFLDLSVKRKKDK